MSLRTLDSFGLSMCNGSHRSAEAQSKQTRTSHKQVRGAGSALNAATDLQLAITTLCSVKHVKVGKVTAKLDEVFVTNLQRAADRRATKRVEDEEEAMRKIAKKGVKFNNALEEPLAQTVGDLLAHMKAMGNAIGVSKEYLKRQFNGCLPSCVLKKMPTRIHLLGSNSARTTKRMKKLKMTPSDNQNDLEYLQELVLQMMKADSRRGAVDTQPVALEGLLRRVATINVGTTSANALKLRKQMESDECFQATQAADPWLLFSTKQYVGKICFLRDIAERHKLYRVSNIAYWTSTKQRYANWEATLEPIQVSPTGQFYVADEDVMVGPKGIRLTRSKVLLGGCILAQYIDGDDEEPTRTECVDLYIENALDKFKAYIFKLQQHGKA
jgi:hypothetical protein